MFFLFFVYFFVCFLFCCLLICLFSFFLLGLGLYSNQVYSKLCFKGFWQYFSWCVCFKKWLGGNKKAATKRTRGCTVFW